LHIPTDCKDQIHIKEGHKEISQKKSIKHMVRTRYGVAIIWLCWYAGVAIRCSCCWYAPGV